MCSRERISGGGKVRKAPSVSNQHVGFFAGRESGVCVSEPSSPLSHFSTNTRTVEIRLLSGVSLLGFPPRSSQRKTHKGITFSYINSHLGRQFNNIMFLCVCLAAIDKEERNPPHSMILNTLPFMRVCVAEREWNWFPIVTERRGLGRDI